MRAWFPQVPGANLPLSLPHLAKSLLVLEGPGATFHHLPAPSQSGSLGMEDGVSDPHSDMLGIEMEHF